MKARVNPTDRLERAIRLMVRAANTGSYRALARESRRAERISRPLGDPCAGDFVSERAELLGAIASALRSADSPDSGAREIGVPLSLLRHMASARRVI